MKWWEEINQINDAKIRGLITEMIEVYIENGEGSKEAEQKELQIKNILIINKAKTLYRKIQSINAGCTTE